MSIDFETAQANMGQLVEWAEKNAADKARNEADTRLHLIDWLVFDCLGWGRDDCSTEERYDGRFADYALGRPFRQLIIEAKKEGIHFELPAGLEKRICQLKTVLDSDQRIDEAVRQALGYSQDRGVAVGAICNGHQIVAFLASRLDGVPPLDGLALVFTSLQDMQASFKVLWDNLSKPGLASYNLHSSLKDRAAVPPPEKLSKRLPDYPGFKNRNPYQTELKILGELFIEDIAQTPQREDEFLRQCYCPSGALSQYALIGKRILQTRYSSLFQKEVEIPALQPARAKNGLAKEFTGDILAAGLKRRAIILLGDVGVGKTIFIRHFIRVEAKDVLEKAIVIYIDFGKEPALANDLQSFVLRRCERQLLNEYKIDIEEKNFVRGVYHSELQRFSKGVFSELKSSDPQGYLTKELQFLEQKMQDRAAHLRSCLEHISKAHKRQIVVFLDNVDQRPFEFQDQVFLIGQSLSETWPATVFISLRPATFFHSRNKGSLAAYQPRVFTVAPPRVDLVISKRMQFARTQLLETGRLESFPGISLQSATLNKYIGVLLDSFTARHELMEFIDNLSGGNVRQALDFVNSFVGSGHVDALKILSAVDESGSYRIPVHEFMRAVVYGDHQHYDPSASPVANLFDISQPDGREHFLLANILAFVERTGAIGGEEGFVEADRIYDSCQSLGFAPFQVKFANERALSKKLVEPSPRFSEVDVAMSYRITTVGAYTAKELAKHFNYVDAMIADTPIVDVEVRKAIGNSQSLGERLDRCELFKRYLDEQWKLFADKEVAYDWIGVSEALGYDIAKVRRKAL